MNNIKKCSMIFVGKLSSIDSEVKEALRKMNENLREAFRRGEEYRKTSTKKWGGTPKNKIIGKQ